MAVHRSVDAGVRKAVAGVRAMLMRLVPVIFNCAVPVTPLNVALMVTLPAATAVATALLNFATVRSLEAQMTSPEMT